MKKSWLFVFSAAPYSGTASQELLDQLMTVAAFDQPVTLLLLDDGVYHLRQGQQSGLGGSRDISRMFAALSMLDVPEPLVEAESLQERGMKSPDLSQAVQIVQRSSISELISRYDLVVGL